MLGYFGFLAVNYQVPFFEASDEAEHFLYIHSILEHNALPVIRSRDQIITDISPAEIWNNHTHHAPLYYMMGAALISWSNRDDINDYLQPNDVIFVRGITANNPNKWLHTPYPPTGDTHLAIMTLRAVNTLLGMVTLGLIYLTAQAAWNNPTVSALAMLITASIPSFISVSTSVTNDALLITLYTAGIFLAVITWRDRQITLRHAAILSLIVTGAALAKLTGLTLIALVGMLLIVGAWMGHYPVRQVARTIFCMGGAWLLLAGWWYIRNKTLYGDFFAMQATQSLWGREFDIPIEGASIGAEVERLIRSFWLMIGYKHQPVLAGDAFTFYATLLSGLGILSAFYGRKLTMRQKTLVGWFGAICVVTVVALIVGTRGVDISYGRLLFPALSPFALLVAYGWVARMRRWAVFFILPLCLFALTTPTQIKATYPALTLLESASSPYEALTLESVTFLQDAVTQADTLHLQITFAGRHPDNPYLRATAIDSVTLEQVGHVELYLGMAATDTLHADGRYRANIAIPLIAPQVPTAPRRVDVMLTWSNSPDEQVITHGIIRFDSRYQPQTPSIPRNIRFGEQIALDGYRLTVDSVQVQVAFWWQALAAISEDWTLTVQLLDNGGRVIAQSDGMPIGYPTSQWRRGVVFVDERTLTIPPDTPAGTYQLIIAWYRLADLQRLEVTSENAPNQTIPLTEITYP
jgi:hypothetical protein